MLCLKRRSSTKQVKKDVGGFFCRVGSVDLALNKKERTSAADLLCGKHRSASKQEKEGVGGFFSRVRSLILYLNM